MLSSVTIENFKSYRKATLKLAPLTVLIGANASGKSNAIEALRLLSWIAEGKRRGTIRHDLLEKERAIRGAIVDTSVLLNVLDRFGELLDAGASILLPLGAVFQTGNHIADVADGRQRRRCAAAFTDQVQRALKRQAPRTLAPLPDADQLPGWLDTFPDEAMKRLGMVDPSIKKEWERACGQHPHRRVVIRALDQHLAGYDRIP